MSVAVGQNVKAVIRTSLGNIWCVEMSVMV